MGTVYHCLTEDKRYFPPKTTLAHQAKTEEEAIEYLETHGGGIYRNILHNFDCLIKPRQNASERSQ